jgi:hypothetical protein
MEVGISTPILEMSFEDYGHLLTFCWIKILGKGTPVEKQYFSLQLGTSLAKTTMRR